MKQVKANIKLNFTLSYVLVAVMTTCLSFQALGQTFNSKNNYTGEWAESDTWNGGTVPGSTISGGTVNIYGFVIHEGDLNIYYGRLVVFDTLWISEDMTVTLGEITVQPGGILIVDGDIRMNSISQLNNNGKTVVKEDLNVLNGFLIPGGAVDNTGDMYVYGAVTGNNIDGNPIKDEDDLANENLPLLEFVNGTPMPVELLYFEAVAILGQVQLNWATAMEDNFDFFTVERAGEDGNFQAVGEIKGVGFSTEEVNYNFTDTHPLSGLNLYRLKATDLDGSVEYHRIISAWVEKGRSEVIVYPNPVVGNENLFINTNSHHNQEVIIADLFGNMLVKTTVNAGVNEIELPEKLKAGSYLVSVTQADGSKQHIRLLKN